MKEVELDEKRAIKGCLFKHVNGEGKINRKTICKLLAEPANSVPPNNQ